MSDGSGTLARRFEGRTALVTGGASGIGEATAARLAAEGANVVVADLDAEAGERTAAQYDGVSFIQTDVSDSAQVQSLVTTIVDRHGRLDAVHANAGIETPFLLLAQTPDEWFDRAIAVNTRGVFCALGDGAVDLDGFLATLRELDYAGWVVIEQDQRLGDRVTLPMARDAARRNRAYLTDRGL